MICGFDWLSGTEQQSYPFFENDEGAEYHENTFMQKCFHGNILLHKTVFTFSHLPPGVPQVPELKKFDVFSGFLLASTGLEPKKEGPPNRRAPPRIIKMKKRVLVRLYRPARRDTVRSSDIPRRRTALHEGARRGYAGDPILRIVN